ncbi:MAG: phosphate/phosphite/phosphonate ABC transporter substrate-binding protein [Bryobacterales bacterium]|nr:phosphate/phosphite/phosphonate ABC transporter substrate-binding protein [Bryobacterales bacterium]
MSGQQSRTAWAVRAWRWLPMLSLLVAMTTQLGLGQSATRIGDATHAAESSAAANLRSTRLNVIISDGMLGTLSRNDAIAAVTTWADYIGKEYGFSIRSSVRPTSSTREVRQMLERDEADVLLLEVSEYFELEERRMVAPLVLDLLSGTDDPRTSYIVVVHPESAANSLADLQQSRLLLYPKLQSGTAVAWLTMELVDQSLAEMTQHFAGVQRVNRPQDCVLPVYFKKGDACLVDEHSFQLLGEMNAQLKRLRVIARSAPLLDRVTSTPIKPHRYRADLVKAIVELSQSTHGKQLLTVFRSAGHALAEDKHLRTSREFWRRYRALQSSKGKQGGA